MPLRHPVVDENGQLLGHHKVVHVLNRWFQTAMTEYSYGGFRYDVALLGNDPSRFFALEIHRFNPSTYLKCENTRYLLEMKVRKLRDLMEIQNHGLRARLELTRSTLKPIALVKAGNKLILPWEDEPRIFEQERRSR
jgi:hypothetical protein